MKIDFRKEIDPVCGYNPKILTCDGTHIGVSIKHLHLDKPVTQPDTDEIMKAKHQRIRRLLIGKKKYQRSNSLLLQWHNGTNHKWWKSNLCKPTANTLQFTPNCTELLFTTNKEFHLNCHWQKPGWKPPQRNELPPPHAYRRCCNFFSHSFIFTPSSYNGLHITEIP